MRQIDESYLLKKLKEGDVHALEVIFNRYYGSLCNYLFLLFKHKIVVEHIAQDIFVYLWENRDSLDIKVSLESYLYTAGKYKGLNQIRNKKRQESILNEMGIASPEKLIISENTLETNELKQILEEAISSLPERCQQIFRLSRDDGMSYQEISNFLNISVNTVEGQITIALRKLRALLKPYYLGVLLALLNNLIIIFVTGH